MCILIINDKAVQLDDTIVEQSINQNPDGYARFDLRTGQIIRTVELDKAKRIMAERIPAIHHARWASVGGKGIDNVHPFHIDERFVLFQNGTIRGMETELQETDTGRLAKAMQHVNPDRFKEFLDNFASRFVVADIATQQYIQAGSGWSEYEGMQFSNCDVLPSTYVAVYGTLKRGHGNHRLLTGKDVWYLGEAYTVDKHRLYDEGLPYLHKGEKDGQGKRVKVEVYRVPMSLLTGPLDTLEGHPIHYRRELVQVEMAARASKYTREAWVYFATSDWNAHNRVNAECLTEYKGSRVVGAYGGGTISKFMSQGDYSDWGLGREAAVSHIGAFSHLLEEMSDDDEPQQVRKPHKDHKTGEVYNYYLTCPTCLREDLLDANDEYQWCENCGWWCDHTTGRTTPGITPLDRMLPGSDDNSASVMVD